MMGLVILALGMTIPAFLLGYSIGRSKGLKPYKDGMDFCDHLKRYSECGYCKHMVKPREATT